MGLNLYEVRRCRPESKVDTRGSRAARVREAYAIQRRSKQLTRNTVSAILKETSCVSGGNRIERFAYSFHQRFPTPSLRLTEKTLTFEKASSMGLKSGEYGG